VNKDAVVDPLDQRFNALLCGYRPTGGLARDSEIAARVAARNPGGFAWLARRIAHRELLFFTWREVLWFPVFQFERSDMSQRRGVACVVAELAGWTEDWERADWFLRPQRELGHRAPIALIDSQPQRIVEVARMERYLHNV